MSDLVTELHIVCDDNNIFDTDMEYIIPLYQRAYAWEDKQLVQLIEDINDVAADANYYIGALIVSRQGNKVRGCRWAAALDVTVSFAELPWL